MKKSNGWTEAELERLLGQGKIKGYKSVSGLNQVIGAPEKKRSKYGSVKTEVNGIVFDSEREAKRYKDLLLMFKAGAIGFLELQVPYELNPGGSHSLRYIADFVYMDQVTGLQVVEDCKGFRTPEYKKKKRLMRKIHNIKIFET